MKILVTGASGFLGRFLTPFLREQGHCVQEVTSKNCDLTNSNSLHQFNGEKYDQIYHLAAWTQAGDFCLRHPGQQWIINQKINTHILDWWQEHQSQAKMIAMGTSCSYDPSLPLEEANYLMGSPIDSLYTYAMTKRMLLTGLMALQKQYGLQYLYVVPSTLYGGGYHTDGRQLHFIFDLIRKIICGRRFGGRVVLWGDGEQKREVVHVKDFIKTMCELVETQSNMVVNIGAGEEYSIREYARIISNHVGFSFDRIEYDLSKYVGARSKVLSISKLKKLLPHFQPVSLEQGIQEVIDWFHQNPEMLQEHTLQ